MQCDLAGIKKLLYWINLAWFYPDTIPILFQWVWFHIEMKKKATTQTRTSHAGLSDTGIRQKI